MKRLRAVPWVYLLWLGHGLGSEDSQTLGERTRDPMSGPPTKMRGQVLRREAARRGRRGRGMVSAERAAHWVSFSLYSLRLSAKLCKNFSLDSGYLEEFGEEV